MNTNFFEIKRDSSCTEADTDSQHLDNNTNKNHEDENNEVLQELHIKRDTRNTSEKFRDHDLPDLDNDNSPSKDNESDTTHDTSQQISATSLENLDEPLLQLPAPAPTNTERNSLQVASGSIMNLLQNVISPIRQPSIPRIEHVQQTRSQRNPLFSLFTSLPLFRHNSNNLNNLANDNHTNTQSNESNELDIIRDHEHEQPNQVQQNNNIPDVMEHGAIIIRTVQPGPNGLMIVRMRVIPFNEIFGARGDTEESNGINSGLFGTLFSLFTSASNIHIERGLEKETLDSLPVVTYDTDRFKNVDEESKRCTICYDHYQDGEEVKYLWCLHRFHKGCVDQWLGNHTTCPFCKKDYSDLEKTDFE